MDVRNLVINELSVLSSFLVWAETDNTCMYGTYTPTQALESLARLIILSGLSNHHTADEVLVKLRSIRE